MKTKSIVAILWEDHVYIDRGIMAEDPDEILTTNLSVGIIYKETKKVIILVNGIERYEDRDDVSYTVILKSTIQGIKEYGEIKIEKLRE